MRMRYFRSATVLCVSILVSAQLWAIEIDGKLNEAEWQDARVYSNFQTVEPFTLGSPEYPSEARLFVDDKGIYLAFINRQPSSTQRSERVQRDGHLSGDKNQIVLDFDNNSVAAYGFEIANGGSIVDGIWSDETQFSSDWDGNWQAATQSNDEDWVAEVFIPWDIAPMAKSNAERRKIGFYLGRHVAHLNKKYATAPTDNDRPRFLSELPNIEIDNFSSASFKLFASATARQDLLHDESYFDPSLDLFWQPDSSKQLSLTLNPDFGQVESDNLVVNFSPEETFFNEKRPFFTENQSIFDLRGPFDLRVIHTRRMGGPADLGDENVDIDAAAKFTSNGQQWSYGLFGVLESDGDVAQGRDFYAARLTRKSEKLRLGYLLTHTERPDLERSASTHNVDYEWGLSKSFKLLGMLSHAQVEGFNLPPEESGSEYIEQSDIGVSTIAEHTLNENWSQSIEYAYYGEDFEINDMGFLSRNDVKSVEYKAHWQKPVQVQSSRLSGRNFGLTTEHKTNADNLLLENYIDVDFGWNFKDSSSLNTWFYLEGEGHDDRITRGNRVLNKDGGYILGYHFNGKARKRLRFHHRFVLRDLPVDGRGYHAHFHPTYYFSDNYSLEWGLHYNYRDSWLLWEEANNLNTYTRKQFDTSININAQLSEKQELRIKFQWLSLNAEAEDSYTIGEDGDLIAQQREVESFTLSDTALQIRYKYRLGPLSNIFFVYSRGGRFSVDEDQNPFSTFAPSWRERTGDNILLKVRFQI